MSLPVLSDLQKRNFTVRFNAIKSSLTVSLLCCYYWLHWYTHYVLSVCCCCCCLFVCWPILKCSYWLYRRL